MVKTLGMAMATAGLTAGLAEVLKIDLDPTKIGQDPNRVVAHLKANLVKAVAKGAVKVEAGEKLEDVLKDGSLDVAAGVAGGVAANNIGEAYGQGDLDPLTHKALHAALGAGLGALKNPDDLKNALMTGAFAGSVSEIFMEVLAKDIGSMIHKAHQEGGIEGREAILRDYLDRQADIAKLLTVGLAGVLKQDIDLAQDVADNATKNNFVLQAIGLGITVWEMIDAYEEGGWTEAAKVGAIGAGLSLVGGKILKTAYKGFKKGAESVWKKSPLDRGEIIEKLLGQNLHQNFPVIDRFKDGIVTSIKSLDLNAKTYQNANKLRAKLKQYVDKVANFKGDTFAGREIFPHQIKGKTLDLAIPTKSNAQQRSILKEIEDYAKSKGVDLNIIKFN